jgi:Transposase domain (DUF772)
VAPLLLYAYSRNQRSSRVIERECLEDIAYRVIAMNERPDHSTIARFVARHEDALAGVFGSVLKVCAMAGLVNVAVIAVDGSKVSAAVNEQTLDFEQIARQVIEEAKAVDAAEDELYGDRRGMNCRPSSRPRRVARRGLRKRCESSPTSRQPKRPIRNPRARTSTMRRSSSSRASSRWSRATRAAVGGCAKRAASSISTARGTQGRLRAPGGAGCRRGCGSWMRLDAERQANEAYEAYRTRGRMKDGRRFGRPPDPYVPPELPAGKINVTDPDSRLLKAMKGYVQGYNGSWSRPRTRS